MKLRTVQVLMISMYLVSSLCFPALAIEKPELRGAKAAANPSFVVDIVAKKAESAEALAATSEEADSYNENNNSDPAIATICNDFSDCFGRPRGQHCAVSYYDSVRLRTIYTDLGMTHASSSVKLYINGILQNMSDYRVSSDASTKLSDIDDRIGKGTKVEVFYDATSNELIICAISCYSAKITDIRSIDGNQICVFTPSDNAPKAFELHRSNEFLSDDFEVGDIVAYTYSDDTQEIVSAYKMACVEGTLDQRVDETSITLDGNLYTYGRNYGFDACTNEEALVHQQTYAIYIDEYGFVLYIDDPIVNIEQYALLLAVQDATAWNDNRNRAKLLFSDGTKKQ